MGCPPPGPKPAGPINASETLLVPSHLGPSCSLWGWRSGEIGASEPCGDRGPALPDPQGPVGAGRWGACAMGHICVDVPATYVIMTAGVMGARAGDEATASPGRMRWGHGEGCWAPSAGFEGVGWIWGAGRCGGASAERTASLCVGGGEDVGGWELISWSLVSAQSLDASPCLAASSQPAPAPLSLPVAPHLPQIPSCPPGNATQPPPCPVHRLRAQGERGGDWGRGEKASVLSLRFHPMLAPAHGCPYQQARDRAAPPQVTEQVEQNRFSSPPRTLAQAPLGFPCLGWPGAAAGLPARPPAPRVTRCSPCHQPQRPHPHLSSRPPRRAEQGK